jgi:hypothetical protein
LAKRGIKQTIKTNKNKMFTTTIIDDLCEMTNEIQSLLDELNELAEEQNTREEIISLLK